MSQNKEIDTVYCKSIKKKDWGEEQLIHTSVRLESIDEKLVEEIKEKFKNFITEVEKLV